MTETVEWELPADKVALLKSRTMKPEEIDGDDKTQALRVQELLRWFARYATGDANGKWAVAHAFELAFYIATKDQRHQIDISEMTMKAWRDGLSEPPEIRDMAIRHGWITPKAGRQDAA